MLICIDFLLELDCVWRVVDFADEVQFRVLEKSELPEDCDTGTEFTSVCINTAVYLPWILGQCVKAGVTIKRGILSHISEAGSLHSSGHADVVVNCTGLLASKLGGVMDANVYPGRGQIVLVRNEPGVMLTVSGTDDGGDEATYIMQRAVGGGTILGGCLQHESWESQPDPTLHNALCNALLICVLRWYRKQARSLSSALSDTV
jgi:D-amino-acid oxidase